MLHQRINGNIIQNGTGTVVFYRFADWSKTTQSFLCRNSIVLKFFHFFLLINVASTNNRQYYTVTIQTVLCIQNGTGTGFLPLCRLIKNNTIFPVQKFNSPYFFLSFFIDKCLAKLWDERYFFERRKKKLYHSSACLSVCYTRLAVYSRLYFYLLLCDVEYVVAVLEVLANLQVGIALRICVTICAE